MVVALYAIHNNDKEWNSIMAQRRTVNTMLQSNIALNIIEQMHKVLLKNFLQTFDRMEGYILSFNFQLK